MDLLKPVEVIQEGVTLAKNTLKKFEPDDQIVNTPQREAFYDKSPCGWDRMRDFIAGFCVEKTEFGYTGRMKIVRLWGPLVVWMVVIFVLSGRQSISVSKDYWLNFLIFKLLHVLEYAFLYILTFRATKNPVTSFIIVILYAASDEIHQLFVPTREGRVRDVIIDTAGAVFAWISITKLLPRSPKKLRAWVKTWLAI